MALKEKTVELNLTSEVIHALVALTAKRVSVWAPTPKQEAKKGFDAKVQAAGFKLLIQYKAAKWHQPSGEWRFKLNETAGQDQHARLCAHAAAGIRTFYALPLFDRYQVIRQNMQKWTLLTMPLVLWIDPRHIPMPNKGIGKHTLGVKATPPNKQTVYSDPIEFESPRNGLRDALFEIMNEEGGQRSESGRGGGDGKPPEPPDEDDDGDDDGEQGTGLVGFHLS